MDGNPWQSPIRTWLPGDGSGMSHLGTNKEKIDGDATHNTNTYDQEHHHLMTHSAVLHPMVAGTVSRMKRKRHSIRTLPPHHSNTHTKNTQKTPVHSIETLKSSYKGATVPAVGGQRVLVPVDALGLPVAPKTRRDKKVGENIIPTINEMIVLELPSPP